MVADPDPNESVDDDWDEWQQDVAAFVLQELPAPPCRVLDVGCGDGWLVRLLDDRGYDAQGIDPQAPEDDPRLTRTRLEDFEPDRPFDAALAVLPLHHVDDLDLVVVTIAGLLAPSGVMLCVEFAWDRFDDVTARWCLERLPAELDDHNWLHELCRPLLRRYEQERPLRASEVMRGWAFEHGFHPSVEVLEQLRAGFVEQRLEWGPYLYQDLAIDANVERAAIEEGRIPAMSFRFTGRPDRAGG